MTNEQAAYLKEVKEVLESTPDISDFFNKYTVVNNPKSTVGVSYDDVSFGFESYGEDYEKVMAVYNTDPSRVWTLIESDSLYDQGCESCDFAEDEEAHDACDCRHTGTLWISSGLHFVNRIGYLITEEPCDGDQEYIFD